jgi:hypothetical protein
MEANTKERRKPGPIADPSLERYTLTLSRDDAEWGKRQPGGLSELIRRLLKKAREEVEGKVSSS